MDYIEIKGYKSIKEQRVELNKINILIGANGSGKSNFISFFEFLNRLYNRTLNEYVALKGGEDKISHKGGKVTDTLSFKVEFENGNNGYAVTLKASESGFIFTSEKLIYQQDYGVSISSNARESNLRTTTNYRAKYVIRYLNGFRIYHFHDTGEKSPFTQMSHTENDIYYLYGKGDNLAAFLYNIHEKEPIIYNRIIKIIQSIAPYFSDFFLQPNEANYLRLQWKDTYSDVIYGVNDLSDGTIRFIALTTLFMQPDLPDTILIDEPELGLHPAAVSMLAGMIKSVAAKGCQVIIATQSTDLISHFSPEDILTVDRIGGETIFKRLDSKSLAVWLDDYTIGDLWKRNIIASGQPNYK
ncbi:cobalt transporter ATP-binding subunit [Bacteroidales bacterium Barb6XT]|nr:cobalt transporter ATP-binding subunit [Bacteroidales bacterium Barb6XT]